MSDATRICVALGLSFSLCACDRGGEPVKTETKVETKAQEVPVAPPPTDSKTGDDPVATPTPATPEPTTPTAPAIPAAPAGPPGPAYFAINKKGIIRLDAGKFTVLANSPDTLIKGLQVGGDGKVWVVGFQDLLRLEGDKFRKVTEAGFSELGGSIDSFAVTADGHVWAATFKGVSHYDGKSWKTEEKATIGAGDDLLQGIAVDPAGKVWVASTYKVHVREGEVWKTIDLGKAASGQQFFESIKLAPDGAVYALSSTALLRLGPAVDAVTAVALGGRSIASYGDLNVSANGALAVRDGSSAIVVPAGGASRVFESAKGRDFVADNIRAVAADDGGRLWVASDIGVTVLGPGDAKTEWPSGSIAELVGQVEDILVVGSGPAALPAPGAVRKAGLTGKLLAGGSPLVGADVEICPSPAMMFTDSPCGDSPLKFVGVADDKGVWTFQDVPLGTYGIAVKVDGKWQITLGERLGEGMKEGQVYDTGSLVLERK